MKLMPENHIELAIFVLSLFSGIITVILGKIYNKKIKSIEIRRCLTFSGVLGVLIFTSFIKYYYNYFAGESAGDYIITTIFDLIFMITLVLLYFAISAITKIKKKRELIAIAAYCSVYIIFYQVIYLKYSNMAANTGFSVVNVVIMAVEFISLAIIFLLFIRLIRFTKKMENGEIKKHLKIFLIMIGVYIVIDFIGIYDYYIVIFYMMMNVYAIKIFINHLTRDNEKTDILTIDKNIKNDEKIDRIEKRYNLTASEKEIAELLCRGCTNSEIAEIRGVTLNTVKRHVYNIFKKLDVSNRVELVHAINSSIEKESEDK